MSSILQPIFINCKIKGGKQPNTRQGFKQVSQKFPKGASTWGTSLTKAIATSLLTSAFTRSLEPHVVHIRTSDNVPKAWELWLWVFLWKAIQSPPSWKALNNLGMNLNIKISPPFDQARHCLGAFAWSKKKKKDR